MLHELRKCRNSKDLDKALSQLPKSLNELYDHILSRNSDEYDAVLHRALQWICLSAGPITVDELNDAAVAFDTSTSLCQFDPILRPSDKMQLIRQLSSLIIVGPSYILKTYWNSKDYVSEVSFFFKA